jgi:hypothetical protein
MHTLGVIAATMEAAAKKKALKEQNLKKVPLMRSRCKLQTWSCSTLYLRRWVARYLFTLGST